LIITKGEEPPEAETPKEEIPEEETPEPESIEADTVTEEAVIECPSCGAHVPPDAESCNICGATFLTDGLVTDTHLVEREVDEEAPVEEIPEAELPPEDETPSEVEVEMPPEDMPEEELPPMDEEIPEDLPEPVEEEPTVDEKACPSCGAFVPLDATECSICETPFDELPVTEEPEPEPVEELPELEPAPEEQPPAEEEEEIICPGCGAFLDVGATECFICGAKLGEAEAEAPVPEEPEPEPVEEEVVEEIEEVEEVVEEVPVEEEVEVIELEEGEIICPSCSNVIKEESEKCPECWTDLSLYVKCPSCSLLTPAGEESCRECFAPLAIEVEEVVEEIEEEDFMPKDVVLSETVEISTELQEEMSVLEAEESGERECLVCGAILELDEDVCPICKIEYGMEIEKLMPPEELWAGMGLEFAPTAYNCPSCGEKVVGLDASEREILETKWFYRGIVTIFTGIFFTSFSVWVRGITVEDASLGLHPPPTDIVLNLLGWILVIFGFIFWYLSWKLHEERMECPSCGIETSPDMEMCINCGIELIEKDEDELAQEDDEMLEEEFIAEEAEPVSETESAEEAKPLEDYEESTEIDALPEVAPGSDALEDIPTSEMEPDELPEEGPGAELPTDHEEHKKCPGCGIYVDLDEAQCPICDTEFPPDDAIPDETVEDIPEEEAGSTSDEAMPDETSEETVEEDAELTSDEAMPDETPDETVEEDTDIPSEESELETFGPIDEGDAAEKPADLEDDTLEDIPVEESIEDIPIEEPAEDIADVEEGAVEDAPVEEAPVEDSGDQPEESKGDAESAECPSCGAVIEPGVKACPICEYPIE